MAKTMVITIQAPANLCGFCGAEIRQNLFTKQYFIWRKGNCSWCQNTGDHDYPYNGIVTVTDYVVGKINVQ